MINDKGHTDERQSKLLHQVHQFVFTPREQTLLSIGGRGYYENPASDLLAFFFAPQADHGFGALFLEVFLRCIGEDPGEFKFDGVTVATRKLGIDILVSGGGWVLVVENKIRHIQNNPWTEYEATALRSGRRVLLAILSPGGNSEAPSNWKPISYRSYCAALRNALASAFFNRPYSKWIVLAREFILHLETELYEPTMSLEQRQIDFLEKYLPEAAQVTALRNQYMDFIMKDLQKRLHEAIPLYEFTAWEREHALKVKDQGPYVWECDFKTPGHSESEGKFHFTIWRKNLTPDQRHSAAGLLSMLSHETEGRSWDGWSTIHGYDDRLAALDALSQTARQLSQLWDEPLTGPNPKEGSDTMASGVF